MSNVGKYSDSGFGPCFEGLIFKETDSKYAESRLTYECHLTKQEIVSLCLLHLQEFQKCKKNWKTSGTCCTIFIKKISWNVPIFGNGGQSRRAMKVKSQNFYIKLPSFFVFKKI